MDQSGLGHVASVVARISALLGLHDPLDAHMRLHDLIASLGLTPLADEAAGTVVHRERWIAEVDEQGLGYNPRRINRRHLSAIVGAV